MRFGTISTSTAQSSVLRTIQTTMPPNELAGSLISRPNGRSMLPITCCQSGGTFGVRKKHTHNENTTPQMNR
jgi:hypothetical protein